jgi:hypothetical protein
MSIKVSTVYAPQRPCPGSGRAPITSVRMPLARIAPQHIGHGSNVVYKVIPEKSVRCNAAPALRSATVSA